MAEGNHRAIAAAVTDPARIAAVAKTGLVDTGPEEVFDRLARLASTLLHTPFAFVTLVDERRSWYKSFIGAPDDAQRWGAVEESFCQYVIGSGHECIIGDARDNAMTRDNRALENMGVVAWAGFPVRAPDGAILGTLCVVDTRPREWTDRDTEVLETLAEAASSEVALRIAVEEHRRERARAEEATQRLSTANTALEKVAARAESLADTLRTSLLPPRMPHVEGLDVAAGYSAAGGATDVTGDFYDVFGRTDASWSVVIGDVCGKGPAAAALTAEVRYSVRAEAMHSRVPSRVLTAVNDLMRSDGADNERFVTVAYCTMRKRRDDWRVSVALAGHHHPLLRTADGQIVRVGKPGLPLGLFDDVELSDRRVTLGPGDALVLYTDGLTEARRGAEEFGLDRLERVLAEAEVATAADLVARLQHEVAAFSGGSAHDDIALVALLAR